MNLLKEIYANLLHSDIGIKYGVLSEHKKIDNTESIYRKEFH